MSLDWFRMNAHKLRIRKLSIDELEDGLLDISGRHILSEEDVKVFQLIEEELSKRLLEGKIG